MLGRPQSQEGRASEPAGRSLVPVGRALEQAMRASEEAAALEGLQNQLGPQNQLREPQREPLKGARRGLDLWYHHIEKFSPFFKR